MKKKISIILLLSILMITLRVDYVKATTNFDTKNAIIKEVKEKYDQGQRTAQMLIDLWQAVGDITGFISNKTLVNAEKIIGWFRGYASGGHGFTLPENATDQDVVEEALDYLMTNITVNDDSFTWNDNSRNMFVYINNQVKEEEPWHYMYSYDISQTTNNWTNGVVYNRVRDIIRDHQENNYVFYACDNANINDANFIFWFIPKEDRYQFVYNEGVAPPQLNMADYYTWEWIWSYNGISIVSANIYEFDGTTLVPKEVNTQPTIHMCLLQEEPEDSTIATNGLYGNIYRYLVSTSGHKDQVVVWDSLNAMKNGSVGRKGYYISDSYNNNISGSYNTFDSSNSNNVSYGDVTNYINNYYNQNGEYPTQPVINIYINNNIPTGDGGGGSAGGSGGGSGGSGSDSSIWDFLSRLGEVLSGLISNLGNMLTSLIESIVTIINDVVGKIPTVFNGLLEIVYGGLPEEIRALIVLGITTMVIYGIIKVIRG